MHETLIAMFDWRGGTENDIPLFDAPSPGMCSTIRVCVDEWIRLGLDADQLDQLVWFEIYLAVQQALVMEDLAETLWSQWLGSGEERMEYRLAQWEENESSVFASHIDTAAGSEAREDARNSMQRMES